MEKLRMGQETRRMIRAHTTGPIPLVSLLGACLCLNFACSKESEEGRKLPPPPEVDDWPGKVPLKPVAEPDGTAPPPVRLVPDRWWTVIEGLGLEEAWVFVAGPQKPPLPPGWNVVDSEKFEKNHQPERVDRILFPAGCNVFGVCNGRWLLKRLKPDGRVVILQPLLCPPFELGRDTSAAYALKRLSALDKEHPLRQALSPEVKQYLARHADSLAATKKKALGSLSVPREVSSALGKDLVRLSGAPDLVLRLMKWDAQKSVSLGEFMDPLSNVQVSLFRWLFYEYSADVEGSPPSSWSEAVWDAVRMMNRLVLEGYLAKTPWTYRFLDNATSAMTPEWVVAHLQSGGLRLLTRGGPVGGHVVLVFAASQEATK